MGRFTQGCTASLRAQLSQDFGINAQTLVKLKPSWGSLVPSVTNSYRKVLFFFFTHRLPHPSFYLVAFLAIWPASTWGCSTKPIGQILLYHKAKRPLCGLYFPRCKMNWKRAFKDQRQPDLDYVYEDFLGERNLFRLGLWLHGYAFVRTHRTTYPGNWISLYINLKTF